MALQDKTPHIVVLGAGFGGLEFCKKMSGEPCKITVVDRQNHHLFQPLLYQVATSQLSLPDISEPTRKIFGSCENITVLMDEIVRADPKEKVVHLKSGPINYDYLVIGVGATNNYFGNDEWAKHSIGLKTLKEAFAIKQRVLECLEKAELETDPEKRAKLITIAIVGGGPAGVEMAGAFAELTRDVVSREFRRFDPADARIVLIHSRDKVLNYFPDPLPEKALKSLESKGVEVLLNSRVTNIREGAVEIGDQVIDAGTIIWTAGVAPSPVTKNLGIEVTKRGAIPVRNDCSVDGYPEVFAIGDCAELTDVNGVRLPGVSPAAIQMAKHVAGIIRTEIRDDGPPREAFEYFDKGMMATIGRNSAVASLGKINISGFFGWLLWLLVHLLFLIGFRNKAAVLLQWGYAYLGHGLGARVILEPSPIANEEPRTS